jgi:hypothetical protein
MMEPVAPFPYMSAMHTQIFLDLMPKTNCNTEAGWTPQG